MRKYATAYPAVCGIQLEADATVNAMVVGSILTLEIELLYIIICSCFGDKAKCGIEFHHSTHTASDCDCAV